MQLIVCSVQLCVRFPNIFLAGGWELCLLVLGTRVGKGRGFQWGAHARRSLLPKHTIRRRGYVQLPFRFEA